MTVVHCVSESVTVLRAVAMTAVAMATGYVTADDGTVGATDVWRFDVPQLVATVTLLGLLILATIVGNALVIAAVVLDSNLRHHVANYLVASLAAADLLVALLVMPLAAVNEVLQILPAQLK